MIADLYTKSFQGKLFRLFWDLILNLHEEDIINIVNLEELTKTEKKKKGMIVQNRPNHRRSVLWKMRRSEA